MPCVVGLRVFLISMIPSTRKASMAIAVMAMPRRKKILNS